MHNLEYYGFSLLCRVQQECNSHFNSAPEFFSSSCIDTQSIFRLERIERTRSASSARPAEGCILDFSHLTSKHCPENIAELDLVRRVMGGKFEREAINCLGEACREVGLENVLWRISQWTPDRKRSALILTENGPSWEWVAASFGGYESYRAYAFGGFKNVEKLQRNSGVKHILSDYEIEVSVSRCSKLCELFLDLARSRGLLQSRLSR